jgi:hypothetical protein
MQSVRRQIRRTRAVVTFNGVERRVEIVCRRGTPAGVWRWAIRNRLLDQEARYCEQVTGPLTRTFIDGRGDSRDIYDN